MTQTSFLCNARYSRYWGVPETCVATVSAAVNEPGPYSIRFLEWSKLWAFPTPLIANPSACSACATWSATPGVPTPFNTSTRTSPGGSVWIAGGDVVVVVEVDVVVELGGTVVVVDTTGRVVVGATLVVDATGRVVVTADVVTVVDEWE